MLRTQPTAGSAPASSLCAAGKEVQEGPPEPGRSVAVQLLQAERPPSPQAAPTQRRLTAPLALTPQPSPVTLSLYAISPHPFGEWEHRLLLAEE